MDKFIKIYRRVVNLSPSGFWPGFIVGLIYFSLIFLWFWSVYPLVRLGTGNGWSLLIILISFTITVAAMSSFWGGFSYFYYKLFKKRTLLNPVFCGSLFVILEYLRAWFFGILWFGKNSLLGAHWTIGNLAYLFTDIGPLRQSASYWGIYGIDFFIIFIWAVLFLLIRSKHKRQKMILASEILLAVLVLFSLQAYKNKPGTEVAKLNISIIQTDTPVEPSKNPDELLADFSEKNRLIKEASKKSDIIIFPESADFSKTLSGFLDSASVQKYFSSLSPKDVLIIDSDKISESDGLKSKAIFIDSKDGVIGYYDKKLLTPGGESLPYLASLPLWFFEHIFKNNYISSMTVFSGGTEDSVLSYKNNKIKLAVCSDIISPSLSREGENFDFIVNMNNLAVFGGSRIIEKQLLSMARLRAAENKKYLIISSNSGHSYVIDSLGNLLKSTNSSGYQILTAGVVPNKERTWYNKLGDLPILLLSLAIFSLGFKSFWNAKQD